jgi:hypothetical protein
MQKLDDFLAGPADTLRLIGVSPGDLSAMLAVANNSFTAIVLSMRIAIRDLSTELFFNYAGWTPELRTAHRFKDRTAAESVAFEYKMESAEMVFMDDCLRPIGGALIGNAHQIGRYGSGEWTCDKRD